MSSVILLPTLNLPVPTRRRIPSRRQYSTPPTPRSSRLGTRFRKFRGSPRDSKPTLSADESHSILSIIDPSSSFKADRSLAGTLDGPPPLSVTDLPRSNVVLSLCHGGFGWPMPKRIRISPHEASLERNPRT
ncbi:hypothetical protein BC827DRAFT_460120 [Russula dissimulans]|nr:hypothetical protein BC827DRAFT_460120 [Russula dissimulans]